METGGDLFGVDSDMVVVYLATNAGPAAIRDAAHFRLDVEYLRTLSSILAADWGLRYLGDWHSHHRLGLTAPSGGDRRRIRQVAARNRFASMFEIIVTLDDARGLKVPSVRLHPWAYGEGELATRPLIALQGMSPIREALIARHAVGEQDLHRWQEMSLASVSGFTNGEDTSAESRQLARVCCKSLEDHAVRALEEASGERIERHPTRFGSILAVPVDDGRFVGIALDGTWPCNVLEVDWIDRERGIAEPIRIDLGLNLLVPADVVKLYREARERRESREVEPHVDAETT
jgi:hypothetical protein